MTGRKSSKTGEGRVKRANAVKESVVRSGKRAKNLLLDADALGRAESFSRRHGTTVSRLVSDYLRSLPDFESDVDLSPAVRRLYGIAAGTTADRETYREYLVAKYGGR